MNKDRREVLSHWLSEQSHYHVSVRLNTTSQWMQGFSADVDYYSKFSLGTLAGFVTYWKRLYYRV